jgi:hypothetical protein
MGAQNTVVIDDQSKPRDSQREAVGVTPLTIRLRAVQSIKATVLDD